MKTLPKRQKARKLSGRQTVKSGFDGALIQLGAHIQIQQCLAGKKQDNI